MSSFHARRRPSNAFWLAVGCVVFAFWLANLFSSIVHAQQSSASDYQQGTPGGVVLTDKHGAPAACDQSAIYDASTTGSTQLVALSSGKSIYVCGYAILAGGTVNVKLIYGTGSACATGATNMLPAWQLVAQAGMVDGAPFYRGLKTAASNALCINASGAVAVQAIVYYSQY